MLRRHLHAVHTAQGRDLAQRASELEQANVALQLSVRRYRALALHATDLVILLDRHGVVRYSSPSLTTVLGYDPDSVLGASALDLVHPDDRDRLQVAFRAWSRSSGPSRPVEHRARHADGSWRMVETVANNCLHDAAVGGIILNSRDITERKEAEAALQHQALHDMLTGLANRALLDDRLELGTRHVGREASPLALMLLDLDRFKEVNDTLGHHAGDLLLQHVARILVGLLRGVDTVARLGGDEFAVLLPDADGEGALDVAARIQSALSKPITVDGQCFVVGASIGIAVAPEHGRDAATLMRHADVAMYTAKRAGGGYALYDQAQHRPARQRRLGAFAVPAISPKADQEKQSVVQGTEGAAEAEVLARSEW